MRGLFLVAGGQAIGLCHPELKQFTDHPLGVVLFRVERGAEVEILVKKFFGLSPLLLGWCTELDEPARADAHILQCADAGLTDLFFRILDQIPCPMVEYAFDRLVEFQFLDRVRIDRFNFAVEALEYGDAVANLFEREQVGLITIVEVGRAVGNLIGDVDELSFEWRTEVEQIFGELRKLFCGVITRVETNTCAILDLPAAPSKSSSEISFAC